ncbi:MAG: hypothetical protein R6W78_13085 [Bacteroidales bacterium]
MEKLVSNIAEMVTWLAFCSTVFLAYYYFLKFRNKERILLIEKNVDLSEIYKGGGRREKFEWHFPWYIIGYTLLGIGLGFIAFSIAFLISQKQELHEEIAISILVSASIFFGALGIIIGHSIEQKKKNLRG